MAHIVKRTKHDIYPFISPSAGMKDAAKGKVVLVTVGGKGIGKAIATHFALSSAQTIILSSRNPTSLQDTRTSIHSARPACTIIPLPADVTDEASVQSLFDNLPSTPDILVNNSGVSLAQTSIVDSDPRAWWTDWETNVKGTYLCTRAYLRALAGKPGVILNVSSSVSDVVVPKLSAYAMSKAAVNRFTEFVHAEYAKQGVRCIAFHPGGIAETGMGQAAPEQFRGGLYDTVDLAAGTALYLSTPRAGFLSGRFVYSNWDMEQLETLKEMIVREDLLTSRIRLGGDLSVSVVPPGGSRSA